MSPTGSTPRSVRAAVGVVVAVAAVVVARSVVDRWAGTGFVFSTWSDRDLLRAARFFTEPETVGAELSWGVGGRVPGPLLPALLAIPVAVSDAALDAFRFQTLLDLLGAAAVAWGGWRVAGPIAGAVAATLLVTAGVPQASTTELWNPGLLPLFTGVGTAAAAEVAASRDARRMPLAALGFALAAQLHLAAWLPLVAVLLGAALLRVDGLGRGLLVALGVVLATLAPHLVDEAVHGWPNTRALLDVSQSDLLRGVAPAVDAWRVAAGLAPLVAPEDAGALPPGAGWGAATAVVPGLAALGLLATRGGERRAAGLLALVGLVTAGFFVAEGRVALGGGAVGHQRYLMAAAPAAALLVGIGAAALVRAAADRVAVGGAGLALVLAAGLGVDGAASSAIRAARALDRSTSAVQQARLDDVRAVTGWSLPALAGRVYGAHVGPDGRATAMTNLPLTWALRAQGEPPPTSGPPPCAVLVLDGAAVPGTGEQVVADVLGRAPPGLVVRSASALPRGGALVVYDTTDRLCPVNTAQTYEPLAPERAALGAEDALAVDAPVPLPADGVARRASRLRLEVPGDASDLVLVVDLDRSATPPVLTLSSRRLRGMTWNGGWMRSAVLDDAVLEVHGADGVVEVPVGVSRIGTRGAITPIAVPLRGAPAGLFEVVLRARTRSVVNDVVGDVDGRVRGRLWVP